MNSQRLFSVKKMVWNVRIKAFWYTKVILQSKSWCEIFVLKLSGIQKLFKHRILLLNYNAFKYFYAKNIILEGSEEALLQLPKTNIIMIKLPNLAYLN